MKLASVWLIALFLLGGCALPRQISSPEKLASIKSVIVISGVDETVSLSYTGLTVFNNTTETVPVDWKFNEKILDLLKAQLQPRYQIVPFVYDPAAFQGARASNDTSLGVATGATERVKRHVKPGLADAIVVVSGGPGGYLSFNRVPYGPQVSTSYTINVFDGATLEPIAQSFSGIPCERSLCLNGFEFASRQMPNLPWRGERYAAMPPATAASFRMGIEELIVISVPNTLQRLRLISAPPTS